MNFQELPYHLTKLNIPSNLYSINKGYTEFTYCITKTDKKWVVFYAERGYKNHLRESTSEEKACKYFINWIQKGLRYL